MLSGWIEVEDYDVSFESARHLLHYVAVGRLGRTSDTLPEPAGPITS